MNNKLICALALLLALLTFSSCNAEPVIVASTTSTQNDTNNETNTTGQTVSDSTGVRVGVSGIFFDMPEIVLEEGQSMALQAHIQPENATNKGIAYSLSDPLVARYEKGALTALTAGETILTATADEDGYVARLRVTVKPGMYHPTETKPSEMPSTDKTPSTTETWVDAPLLFISEVMPKNNAYPIKGDFYGYVEFFNPNETAIELSAYALTDDLNFPRMSPLPQRTIPAGGYALVTSEELNIILSSPGKTLYLTYGQDAEVTSVRYPSLQTNEIYTSNGYAFPTPGYENSDNGLRAYLSWRNGPVINEVISSNSKFLPKDGDCRDMVELKNISDKTIDLSDYYLTDSRKKPQKYRLPSVSLAPGQVYVVYCDSSAGQGYAPFDLSKDGEFLGISDGSTFLDAFALPYIPTDRSWGRTVDGLVGYFETPSFGKDNGEGKRALSSAPSVNASSGFYDHTLTVGFVNSGKVYYTTDGSLPTLSSPLYKGEEIRIEKTMTLRAFVIDDGCLTGEDKAFDYFIEAPDLSLPVIKVTALDDDLYGEKGIYTDCMNKSLEIEGHIAMYIDGVQQFSLDCGLKLHGNYSRQYDKKSIHVKFRTRYGASKLNYDLFGDGSVTVFKDFVLRSGSQDRSRAMMRDEFGVSVLRDYLDGLLMQNFRPVNVFVNEKYVGVYYIREKINTRFVSDHTGVSEDTVGIVNSMMYGEWGSYAEWTNEIAPFIRQKDLTTAENYAYICEHIDIDNLIDYYIALTWADNRDGGNTRIWHSSEGDGKWRFIMYDNDLGFGAYLQSKGASSTEFLFGKYDNSTESNNALIYKLFRNTEFRDRFLKRLNELCKTAFSDEVVNRKIDEIAALIDHDLSHGMYINYRDWQKTWLPELRSYVTGRAEVLKKEFSDYFGLTESEKAYYFR